MPGVTEALKTRLLEMLAPILAERGLEVFDIERAGSALRVILDRLDGTVGIDDCAAVSLFLSHALDVDDPIPGSYRLEVSSPGMDRPLRNPGEFRRFSGQLCRVKLLRPAGGNYLAVGHIRGADEHKVCLELASGEHQDVAYEDMASARLEVEF
ncbi:MAG: ribosome maturation factor RimP [Nitrospirota bacterium]|nr:ribosome maturation factor RimP [Nitrospirota bacterium]